MFYSQCTRNKVNRFYERTLRIVYNDGVSTFDQLLDEDKFFCIHDHNIQRLLIEFYQYFHDNSGRSICKKGKYHKLTF